MVGTQEWYDLRKQFEKDATKVLYGIRKDHEENAPAGHFYADGHTNELFRAYMLGYAYAKCKLRGE